MKKSFIGKKFLKNFKFALNKNNKRIDSCVSFLLISFININ